MSQAEKVLQLGDSYSAGVMIGNLFDFYKPLLCGRNTKNWGQLYSESVDPGGEYINRACGGATTDDILGVRDLDIKYGWYLFRPCPESE